MIIYHLVTFVKEPETTGSNYTFILILDNGTWVDQVSVEQTGITLSAVCQKFQQ